MTDAFTSEAPPSDAVIDEKSQGTDTESNDTGPKGSLPVRSDTAKKIVDTEAPPEAAAPPEVPPVEVNRAVETDKTEDPLSTSHLAAPNKAKEAESSNEAQFQQDRAPSEEPKTVNGSVPTEAVDIPQGTDNVGVNRDGTSTVESPPTQAKTNEASPDGGINAAEDRVKFAYTDWVPNVSGGLVISKIPQRTDWSLKSNIKYTQTAERVGFEYALSQIRFMAGYGAEFQHEPVSFSQALLHSTEKLIMITALLPGPWNPAIAAKQIASIDQYSEGRIAVNIVSGWFRQEFTSIGQWWLDHAERYRRSNEFIRCLKGIWTEPRFTFKGDFYQFHNYPLRPKPVSRPGRPHPEIFQAGNSIDARENAATVSDYYFMNGNTLEGFQTQIADVKERAKREGRLDQVKFALNGFVIARETEEEAIQVLQEIQGKANKEAVEAFGDAVKNAGASTANKTGMWADSKFDDLVQYNDGFKTKLIGTVPQIADRILLLKSLGVNIILTAFLHYDEEIESFGQQVLPLVRKLEAEGRGKDQEYEIKLTRGVYRAKEKPGSAKS